MPEKPRGTVGLGPTGSGGPQQDSTVEMSEGDLPTGSGEWQTTHSKRKKCGSGVAEIPGIGGNPASILILSH